MYGPNSCVHTSIKSLSTIQIYLHSNIFSEELRTNSVDESRYSVLDDGTLMIEHTQPVDSGVYECVARNAAGETKTDAVHLTYQGDEPSQ